MSDTSFYRKDKQQALGWALNALSAVALTAGAWFFNSLQTEMSGLRSAVTDLNNTVIRLDERAGRVDEMRSDLRELQGRVRELEKAR